MASGGVVRRFAVEVEDAIAVSSWGLAAVSRSGRCFLAAAGSGFVFDVASSALIQTVRLPRAEKVWVHFVGDTLAVVNRSGVVRVYREDRAMDARIRSEDSVQWLCGVGEDTLVVFEEGGGLTRVTIAPEGLTAEIVSSKGARSGGTVSRLYSSLFATSSEDSRAGPIVNAFDDGSNCVVAVRAGGLVERWSVASSNRKAGKLMWEWNAAATAWEIIGARERSGSIFYDVVGAQYAGDGILCTLVAFSLDNAPARLYVVTCDISPSLSTPVIELIIEVGTWGRNEQHQGSLGSVELVVSANVAYIIFGEEGRAAFVSVSRGVQPPDQIYGEVSFRVPDGETIVEVLDGGGSDEEGGSIAILQRDGFIVTSAGTPAPSLNASLTSVGKALRDAAGDDLPKGANSGVSDVHPASLENKKEGGTGGLEGTRPYGAEGGQTFTQAPEGRLDPKDHMSMETEEMVGGARGPLRDEGHLDLTGVIWRAYKQYAADQIGAARVSLSAVASAFANKGGAVSVPLSRAVLAASSRIVDSGGAGDDELAPSSVLVNRVLAEKQERHAPLLCLVTDTRVLNPRIWDLMDPISRSTLVGNAGRLMAAIAVRSVENAHAGGQEMGPATSMVITEAIQSVSADGIDVYRRVSQFERFLPALRDVFENIVGATFETFEDDAVDMTSVGEVALVALGGVVAALSASLEVRNEVKSKAALELEDRGGWPCSDASISPAKSLLSHAFKIAVACPPMLRGAIETSAADLTDVVIAALREREGAHSASFAAERSTALMKLKENKVEQTLSLAKKYADFEIMLEFTHDSDGFEALFEEWANFFGDDFVRFTFSWLNDNGDMSLLLRPRTGQLGRAQTRFFDEEKRKHIRWVQLLGSEDFKGAAQAGLAQAEDVIKHAGPQSLGNAKTLLSLSKLATLASNSDNSTEALRSQADKQLYLVRAQENLTESTSTALPEEALVHRYVDSEFTDSKSLSVAVVIALEIIKNADLSTEKASDLRDHVWRKCISQDSQKWQGILDLFRNTTLSDIALSEELSTTALFSAAVDARLSSNEAATMLSREVFSSLDLGDDDDLTYRLLRTTIDLAETNCEQPPPPKITVPDTPLAQGSVA